MNVDDFDLDGKADVAVASAEAPIANKPPRILVLLSKGDGTFQTAVTYETDNGSAAGLLAGDFNGDSMPDLAAAFGSRVAVRLGKGDGAFQPAVNYDAPTRLLTVGDLTTTEKQIW